MSQWSALARSCVEMSKNRSASPELLELLIRFTLERRNYRFEGKVETKDTAFPDIAPEWPELSQFVCGVLQFRRDDRQMDWNYSNSKFSSVL